MYKKRSSGWIKHIDFILIDLLCLHIAFVLAYIMHFAGDTYEFGTNPYREPGFYVHYRDKLLFKCAHSRLGNRNAKKF